ncbi:hypothetical protein JCM8097_007389 [Rhodosporidiobolus ruineniae]
MPKQAPRDFQKGPRKPYTRPDGSNPRPSRPSGSTSSSSAPPHRTKFDPSQPRRTHSGQPGRPQKVPAPPKAQSTALDLSNKPLESPPQVEGLTRLNIANCQLASIAFVGAAATTLTWLDVSKNDLSAPGAWDGIEQLKGLFVFTARNCNLEEVPSAVASLVSVKAIVLSHNKLKKLDHIANLPDLNSLIVSNNALTSLPTSLSTLPSLKKIAAAHNQLTPAGLPNLSSLPHLHELRLNDNPSLTSLPSHFGNWGKAPLPAGAASDDAKRQKGRQGLEILELSNCGFESWFGLKELAKQNTVVNLGLKGNKVAEEAIEASSVDEFREKLTVLLPALRILDNKRFDAKFAELKAKRAARSEEQKILDAGPMALALNAAKAAEARVDVDAALKAREREKENKRRRAKGIQELGPGKPKEEREARKKEKREKREKGKGKARADVDAEADEGEDDEETRRLKTRMAQARQDAEDGGDSDVEEMQIEAPPRPVKGKKRDTAAAEDGADAEPARKKKKDRHGEAAEGKKGKKLKGGVLAALRGDSGDENAAATSAKKPAASAAVSAAPAPPAEVVPEKQAAKTSVAKIIEVKRAGEGGKGGGKKGKKAAEAKEKEEAKRKEDVGALLGLLGGGKKEEENAEEKNEPGTGVGEALGGGWGAGSGLFGGGGWD